MQLFNLIAVLHLLGNLGVRALALPAVQILARVGGTPVLPAVQVLAREGGTAVLPCDVSPFLDGQTAEDDLYIRWVTNDGVVCELDNGRSYADDSYRDRAEIRREAAGRQYPLHINLTTFSDAGHYFCKLQKAGKNGQDVTTVHLRIQGPENNVSVDFGGYLSIRLPVTENVRLEFTPRSNSTRADVCEVQQNGLRAGCAFASRAALQNEELRISGITFTDEGTYSVIDGTTENIINTVVLTVEGRLGNFTLDEGGTLPISLCSLNSSCVEFQGRTENSAADKVCEVEKGQVTRPAERYLHRLAMHNGTLLLSNLTAEDDGKYVVREEWGGRAVLTFTLEMKTGRLRTQAQVLGNLGMRTLAVPAVQVPARAGGMPVLPVVRVLAREGGTAVLPCNVLPFLDGPTAEDDLYIRWVTNDGVVCVLDNGRSYADDSYRNRAEIRREAAGCQYPLHINLTTFSDAGHYFCKLQKAGKNGQDVTTVHLRIQGPENNVSVDFGGYLSIHLTVTENVRLEFTPRSNSTRADVCEVQQNGLRAGCAFASRAALQNEELRISGIAFTDEGTYSVIDGMTENIINTVVLTVEGRLGNFMLDEGGTLPISLCSLNSSCVEFQGRTENSAANKVCEVEKGQVTRPAERYLHRLAMHNGTLLLTNLTAEDDGKYVVREEWGGRAVLTLTLKIEAQESPWSIRIISTVVIACALSVLGVISGCCVYKRCYLPKQNEGPTNSSNGTLCRQPRESEEGAELEENVPLNRTQTGDAGEGMPEVPQPCLHRQTPGGEATL